MNYMLNPMSSPIVNTLYLCPQNTILRFLEEEYCLEDLFTQVTREDLRRLNLKGGILCRIWNAIESHKRADSGKLGRGKNWVCFASLFLILFLEFLCRTTLHHI